MSVQFLKITVTALPHCVLHCTRYQLLTYEPNEKPCWALMDPTTTLF